MKTKSEIAQERRLTPEWQEWSHFSFLVRSSTLKNYRKHIDIIDPNRIRSHYYHIDHIIPIGYCFKHNIPAELCSSVENLTMTEAKRNCGRRDGINDEGKALLLKWGHPIIE